MGAGNIALKIGAQGVCKSVTTACASANDAIGEAFREIKFGMHDVVLAGGAEASITKIGIGGFNALTALSTTEDPERSSIPFDKDRNGFVMGKVQGFLSSKVWNMPKNVVLTFWLRLLVMVQTVMPTI